MTEPTTEARYYLDMLAASYAGEYLVSAREHIEHEKQYEAAIKAIKAEAVNAALDRVDTSVEWYIDQGPMYECRGCHRRWYIADSPDEHDRGCVVAAALVAIKAARQP